MSNRTGECEHPECRWHGTEHRHLTLGAWAYARCYDAGDGWPRWEHLPADVRDKWHEAAEAMDAVARGLTS